MTEQFTLECLERAIAADDEPLDPPVFVVPPALLQEPEALQYLMFIHGAGGIVYVSESLLRAPVLLHKAVGEH